MFSVGTHSLAQLLDEESALLAFRRYTRFWLEIVEEVGRDGPTVVERSRESLGAFVLLPTGDGPKLAFVDLGSAAELEQQVHQWRAAIRATPQRGIGLEARTDDPALEARRRLR